MTKNKKDTLNLRPTAGYSLIEPLEAEKKTATGIVLPDTHEEKSQMGKIVAMGKPKKVDGKLFSPEFKIGSTVVYKKWGGDEFKYGLGGKEYMFVKFEDVLAVIK